MRLLMPSPPHFQAWLSLSMLALLALLLPARAAQLRHASTSACNCRDGFADDMVSFGLSTAEDRARKEWLSLLQSGEDAHEQGKRPRDCTCINGMKTYQTTPRDELLGMGLVALSRHLGSCEHKLDGLEEEKDYAIAESEVKVKKANEQTSQAKKSLESLKNVTASDRSRDRERKKTLMKEVNILEKNITSINGQYDAEFSAWWKLKDAMAVELKKTKGCKCKKALLLQRSQKPPPSPDMYKVAQKVEDCENSVIKVSDVIAKAQAAGRKATVDAIENRAKLGRSTADQERLNKLLSQTPHLEGLERTKGNLESMVKARRQKVGKLKATNEDIRKSLAQLESQLKLCLGGKVIDCSVAGVGPL